MKTETFVTNFKKSVREFACKLVINLALVLFFMLVPDVISGAVPLWAAVVLAVAGLLSLNAVCGVLLAPAPQHAAPHTRTARRGRRGVALRVAQGGRAA